MTKSFTAIAALLLATLFLNSGNGLQNTLLSVRADLETFPTALIGMLMSAYFVGYMFGCQYVPQMIRNTGHIRTFVALASIASATALAHSLFVDIVFWTLLRIVSGFCFAGMAMVLESWINERADNSNRGRVLSVYRIVDLGAQTVGNGLLSAANPEGFQLFALVSILVSVALVPVALTRSEAPAPQSDATLNIPRLFKLSPVAASGALITGLANASFWAMGPVFVQQIGYSVETVSVFMTLVIVGAAASQWRLGWTSDRVDRRAVLACTAILGVLASLAIFALGTTNQSTLMFLGFIWGILILPTFGLSVAHANDLAEPGTSVATNGGLLLLHGAGSVVGSTLGAIVMGQFGAPALYLYIALIYAVFAGVCLVRIMSERAVPQDQKTPFSPVPKGATPGVFEIAEDEPSEEQAGEPSSYIADVRA